MSLCRHSEPLVLQLVWKAIEVIRGQRQIANISRITKIIQRDHSYTSKEILHQILKAVRDNMVIETVSLGCKGSKSGLEQEGYWIPEDSKVLAIEATHDWYCFFCHKPGVLLKCINCIRAYHFDCVEELHYADEDDDDTAKKRNSKRKVVTSIPYCKFCIIKDKECGASSPDDIAILNKCLSFIANSVLKTAPDLGAHPNPEDYMHYNYFIREHVDLNTLIKACDGNKFEIPTDFLCQAELIVHNCTLLNGEKHEYTIQAKKMLDICVRELGELAICMNCYYISSTKPTADWFSMPCKPPHRVVWAKQKGFEYWPAKVIQVEDNRVDVRFFGGHHERAWVTPTLMRSIVVSPADLQIKTTKGWKKANEEMKEYIRQTEKVYGSTYAAQIVTFDYIDAETEEDYLRRRASKRQTEAKERSHSERRFIQISATKVREVLLDGEAAEFQHNLSDSISNAQVQMIGQKAKLDEECARTWRYSLDYVLQFREEKKSRINDVRRDAETQTSFISKQDVPSKKLRHTLTKKSTLSCNCKKRYGLALARYKASVRKLRKQEQNKLMTISALCIQQYMKKHQNQNETLEHELLLLKSENDKLKQDLSLSKTS